jgi:hypothetical protein
MKDHPMRIPSIVLLMAVLLAFHLVSMRPSRAADWWRFRGPNGSGISDASQPLPTEWNATQHLQWKAPLPGPGSSSPIVVGNRIFVTC